MSKVAIVYWSGTGNTEAMANYVAEGVKKAGGEADLFTSAEFGADKAGEYDRIAFGCPSMGAEQLEESEFQPMLARFSLAKRLHYSVLTDGATASGCVPGRATA